MSADTIVTGSKLTAIANAIRSKTGGSSQLTLDQMAQAISSLRTTDRLFSRITQGISGSGSYVEQMHALLDYDLTADDFMAIGALTDYLGLNEYAFYNDHYIRDVTLPPNHSGIRTIMSGWFSSSSIRSLTIPARTDGLAWAMSESGPSTSKHGYFAYCRNLRSIDLSNVSSINNSTYNNGMFSSCQSLTSVKLPDIQCAIQKSMFYDCESLETLTIPNGWTMSTVASVWAYCTALKTLDLGTGIANINGSNYGSGAFSRCTAMENLVLRSTSKVNLSSPGNPFSYSGTAQVIPNDLKIWVPGSLVSTYEADTYWGLFSGHFYDLANYDPS